MLGDYLRARRELVQPESVGLPVTGLQHDPGGAQRMCGLLGSGHQRLRHTGAACARWHVDAFDLQIAVQPAHRGVPDRAAVAVTASKPPPRRITLTLPVFERAVSILILAPGESKAPAIAAVLRGPDPHYPASLLPADRTTILTDTAGAP